MFLFRRSRCRIPAARFSTPQKYDYVICIEHKSQCNFRKCECRYSTGIHTVRSSILVSSVSSFFSYLVLHFPFQIFQFASSMHGSYIPRSSLVAELCLFFFLVILAIAPAARYFLYKHLLHGAESLKNWSCS